MKQLQHLAASAARALASYPALTGKERLKRLAKTCLPGMTPAPLDRFSWPNALLGQGLLAYLRAEGDPAAAEAVENYLRRWKKAGFPIRYVDNLMNANLALELEALSEGEQADPGRRQLCREASGACAAWVRKTMDTMAKAEPAKKLLPYRFGHPHWMFADALGMLCPFVCRYGAVYGDGELMQLGIRQLEDFLACGMDAKTGLPYHGYDTETGVKYGIIGWGRACGWMLLGLTQSLPWIPQSDPAYPGLLDACGKLAADIFSWQRPEGGLSWQLQALEGPEDSSVEGMTGVALASFFLWEAQQEKANPGERSEPSAQSLQPLREALSRLESAAARRIDKGRAQGCSGECLGFAEYPQTYGSYPWGDGSVLAFLSLCRLLDQTTGL